MVDASDAYHWKITMLDLQVDLRMSPILARLELTAPSRRNPSLLPLANPKTLKPCFFAGCSSGQSSDGETSGTRDGP